MAGVASHSPGGQQQYPMENKPTCAMDSIAVQASKDKDMPFVIRNQLVREIAAEILGTFVLMSFGLGSQVQHKLNGNEPALILGINMTWGIGVIMACYVCGGVTGAHLNPAVSLAFSTIGRLPLWKVPLYSLAQIIGAFVASALVYFLYYDGFNSYTDGVKIVAGVNGTANLYGTFPSDFLSTWNGVFDQIASTALLLLTICAITDRKNMNVPPAIVPLLIGFSVTANSLAFSYNCQDAINPARDFGPRLFTYVAGWGSEVFSYRNFWWIPIVGPLIGGVVGAALYKLLIELHWTERDEIRHQQRRKHSYYWPDDLADIPYIDDQPGKEPLNSINNIEMSH